MSTTKTKLPRNTGRMGKDALALKRMIAAMKTERAFLKGRLPCENYSRKAGEARLWRMAIEIERLADCIRADAMEIRTALEKGGA